MMKPEVPSQIDVASTIAQAKTGNPIATDALIDYLQPKLRGYFIRRLPNEAEDLTQESLLAITQDLPKFEGREGRDIEISFRAWSFAIAKNRLRDERRKHFRYNQMLFSPQGYEGERASYDEQLSRVIFRSQHKSGEAETEIEVREPEPDLAELLPQFHQRLAEVLTPLQLEIVALRMHGKSLAEIQAEIGIEKGALMQRFHRARQKIEEQIIYPAGFKRVADYGDEAPRFTASGGQLQAVLFLGHYYTSRGFVMVLQPRRKSVDQSLLNQGYVLLIQHASPAEYSAFTQNSRYRRYVTLHRGRLYILPGDLASARETIVSEQIRPSPPREGLVELVAYAKTEEERRILIRAVDKGLIKVERGKFDHFFVEPQDMEAYFKTNGQKRRVSINPRSVTRDISAEPIKIPDIPVIVFTEGQKNEERFFETFSKWFFTIIKHASDRKLPFWRRKRMGYQEIPDINERISRDLYAWLEARGVKFPGYTEATVNEVLRGEKTSLIPGKLHYSLHTITAHISQARRLIEETLLTPAGIKRVAQYKEPRLQQMVKLGRLEGAYFFGRWYTTDDRVERYKRNIGKGRRKGDIYYPTS